MRHYHSYADSSRVFGFQWTHNYQAAIIVDGAGIPNGLLRPSGHTEALKTMSATRYISMMGSGLQLKQNGNTWEVHRNDGTREIYDLTGRFVQLNDHGWITNLVYTGEQLTSVVGPFGHAILLAYDSVGRLSTLTDPAGRVITYGYNLSSGNLGTVTYQDGTFRTYHYENATFPRYLTGITDETGTRYATFSYDAQGRAATTEHAGGTQKFTLSYGATTSTATDALGRVRTYTFDGDQYQHRRISGFAQEGTTRSAVIGLQPTDFQRRATSTTDERGIVTSFVYDTDHLTSQTEAAGTPLARTTSFQYLSPDNDLITLLTEPNRTTAFTYNSLGKVLTRTVTNTATSTTRTWTYTYNALGQRLSADGPRTDQNDLTSWTYYNCTAGAQCGRVQTVTNALNQIVTYNTYNAHGSPLTMTDANGVVTTLTYDFLNRLTSTTVGAETTTLSYYLNGLLKRVTLADGSYLENLYDAAQRLKEVKDNLGNKTVYTLDLMGNATGEAAYDPSLLLRRTRTRVFDALDRVQKDIPASGSLAQSTTFGYDNAGNPTSINAPLARNTTQQFDALGRLQQITDPNLGNTLMGYNANDRVTSVSDPRNLVTSYTYNGFEDLLTQVSPDTGTTTNTFDSGGNLKTSTDARAVITTYTYDALNRVKTAAYKKGTTTDQTITFNYDAGTNGVGRLTSTVDASQSLTWTYDPQGRVLTKTQAVGSVSRAVTYGYTNGPMTSMTLPSGQVVTYQRDTAGRVSGILVGSTAVLNAVVYEPLGPVSGWYWGNGSLATRTYDQDGKVTQIDSAGLKTYSYDDAFRITALGDTVNTGNSWSYGYDVLDRVTSGVRSVGTTRGWSYDANGNRLTETGSAPSTYTVSASSNRVSSTTGALARTYTYDAAGNALTYATVTMTYNNAGRLKTNKKGTATRTYVYNALGQMVKASGGTGGTVHYLYDEAGHLIGEYNATGVMVQETIWLGDIPVATIRPKTGGVDIFYVHSDHLNTPRSVTRPSDNKKRWEWQSDPFGTDLPNENPQALGVFAYNLRFPGQIFDGNAGLHQNWNRDYDPAIGKYVESDPIGLEAGSSTFGYADGSPVDAVDPNGLDAIGITYRGYRVTTPLGRLPLGHAAVVAVNPRTGGTRYYEYGRYSPRSQDVVGARLPEEQGNVQRRRVPDVAIGRDGRPTEASLQRLYDFISRNYGQKRPVDATYYPDASYRAIADYANSVANDRNRESYSFPGNTCYSFRNNAIRSAR